jgi:hypothetical protein
VVEASRDCHNEHSTSEALTSDWVGMVAFTIAPAGSSRFTVPVGVNTTPSDKVFQTTVICTIRKRVLRRTQKIHDKRRIRQGKKLRRESFWFMEEKCSIGL